MSTNDCGNHGSNCCKRKLYRRIFVGVAIFVSVILFVILIIWLSLRPSMPKFYLQDASIYQFNLTAGTNLLTTTMQVTIPSRNPNDRIGVYYGNLDAYAVYKGEQITAPTALPPGYQGHGDVVVWSPYLYGASVPVAPYLSVALQKDDTAGLLMINVKVEGNIRWKVGSWTSGHYRLRANCPVFLSIDHGDDNYKEAPKLFRFQQISECGIDV
ncbi:NDR1/HIN1-like protein 12 [Canna indica]|uniref:NDR1/HIN1-like protein 12 n=1 Tax=Canna indica TaxID=4628 RepID=A0AAQ3QSD6_9LILI|nr:NDR1/HIN1-like protein 12 [Canna indica]